MTRRLQAELLLLAALWGASFLFMRVAAPEFSAAALVFVRVGLAALLLLPMVAWRGEWPALREHWRMVALLGIVNSALPFVLFAVAALVLSASLMAVFNATAPIWAALIAWAWLGERQDRSRVLGLAIGIAGVVGLSWGKAEFKAGAAGVSPALGIAACIVATVLYGMAANITRKKLGGVPPMVVAAGTQSGAALLLLLPALWTWPAQNPGPIAWGSAIALAVLCTALAYILYFHLVTHAGAAKAVSVTFLIPAFAIVWGWLFLGEKPTLLMLAWCGVILVGTALAVGAIRLGASPGAVNAAGTPHELTDGKRHGCD
jgi:drug/metabolite transporter (DMT)-like permease